MSITCSTKWRKLVHLRSTFQLHNCTKEHPLQSFGFNGLPAVPNSLLNGSFVVMHYKGWIVSSPWAVWFISESRNSMDYIFILFSFFSMLERRRWALGFWQGLLQNHFGTGLNSFLCFFYRPPRNLDSRTFITIGEKVDFVFILPSVQAFDLFFCRIPWFTVYLVRFMKWKR